MDGGLILGKLGGLFAKELRVDQYEGVFDLARLNPIRWIEIRRPWIREAARLGSVARTSGGLRGLAARASDS